MTMIHRPTRSQNKGELPSAPDWFNKRQLEKWDELGVKVVDMGIWKDTDYDAFVLLVDNLIGYEESSKVVAEEGMMITGRDGNTVRHPGTIARNACWTNIQPLLVQFGLTPSARSHMGIDSSDAIDPMDTLRLVK